MWVLVVEVGEIFVDILYAAVKTDDTGPYCESVGKASIKVVSYPDGTTQKNCLDSIHSGMFLTSYCLLGKQD